MRNVNSHLLEDKMDEAVTHYINSQQPGESVHVDANTLALNVQEDAGGRVVTVMHSQNFSSQMCRQVSVGEQVSEGGPWNDELLDPDGRLAALVAHLAQHSRTSHHQPITHHKVQTVRGDVDSSVMLDTPMRLFNGHALEQPSEPIVVQVPQLPPLPPLQEMKRCQEPDWFSKAKAALKDEIRILTEPDGTVIELGAGASPAHNKQQSKKSLPHKKRISRKLKRNTGGSTPQQDTVVINCSEEVQQEEILPDNFVTGVQHQEHLPEDAHHIAHEVRPIFICQLCGDFYGEEQLKFYQHLKQHYEPHATIIIENPVPDLGIDKMTNTCIVDNVATLPDSIVELSLENTVPKTMYQSIDKHILYTSSEKSLNYTGNKSHYTTEKESSIPTMEVEKTDLYETLEKLELYSCLKCSKSFRKQKQCEAHIKEAHSSYKLEDMGEFSEPEDLMEGIHVAVEEGGEGAEGEPYEPTLPHLTVDNGHVHQEHVRHWYSRNGGAAALSCGADAYCPVCPARDQPAHSPPHLKEEVLQRILETTEVPNADANFAGNMMPENASDIHPEPEQPQEPLKTSEQTEGDKKKPTKRFECDQCGRVFNHRNSLLYHGLSHNGKQHVCRECGKGFYTTGALRVHKRVHNGDKPYKCDECGRDFRQWSDLKYHKVSIHSNQKHFKCEFCGKQFARKYSLNVHRRIHTGERNYKCEYCTKTFRASSYRLSHMRTHTGDKPYKCAQCEKCFRGTSDLRRHMLTHEKVRNRFEEQKNKGKDTKDDKKTPIQPKTEIKNDITKTDESKSEDDKKTVPFTTRMPVLKSLLDKKQPQKSGKRQAGKKSAPNVTINQSRVTGDGFKLNTEYTNNVELFDTRQGPYGKVKDTYVVEYKDGELGSQNGKIKDGYGDAMMDYKDKVYSERELPILRPIYRTSEQLCDVESDKTVFVNRADSVDGKLMYQVEKSKEFSGTMATGSLSDMREVARDGRADALQGETIENGFFEKLTALYNIPAV